MDERPNSSGLFVATLAALVVGMLLAGGIIGASYLYRRRQEEHARQLAIESLHESLALERIRRQESAEEAKAKTDE